MCIGHHLVVPLSTSAPAGGVVECSSGCSEQGDNMKTVSRGLLDPEFEYRSAANTDVRLTFERVRREQQALRERERRPAKVAVISGESPQSAEVAEGCAAPGLSGACDRGER